MAVGKEPLDTYGLLKTVIDNWSSVFRHSLGPAERNYAGELMAVRNDWAHDKAITTSDALRALDTAERLLGAVSAKPQADALREMSSEVMRQRFEATVPGGADERVQRTITENCRSLKFGDFGFERTGRGR